AKCESRRGAARRVPRETVCLAPAEDEAVGGRGVERAAVRGVASEGVRRAPDEEEVKAKPIGGGVRGVTRESVRRAGLQDEPTEAVAVGGAVRRVPCEGIRVRRSQVEVLGEPVDDAILDDDVVDSGAQG